MRVMKEKGTKILNMCYFTGSEMDFPMEMSGMLIPPKLFGVFLLIISYIKYHFISYVLPPGFMIIFH